MGGGHGPARTFSHAPKTLERWPHDRSESASQEGYLGDRQHLKSPGSDRDLALFNTALDAKLRGFDLFKPRLADVAQGGVMRQRSTCVQQKTGRPVPFQITEPAREALAVKSYSGAQPALALDEHDRACFIFSRSPTILHT